MAYEQGILLIDWWYHDSLPQQLQEELVLFFAGSRVDKYYLSLIA